MSVPRVCFDNNAWSAVLNREEDKDLESIERDGTTKTLKTPDAIIVASADAAQCQYLLTDDVGIQRLNGKHGLTVTIGPYKTGLPDPDQPLLDQLEQ